MSEKKDHVRLSITVSEKRSVDIGDYEKVENFVSIGVERVVAGNKIIDINAQAATQIDVDAAGFRDTTTAILKKLDGIVKENLDKKEKRVRLLTAGCEGISFDSEKKAIQRKIVPEDYKYKNKFGKRHRLTD
jgi:hypothetical protein